MSAKESKESLNMIDPKCKICRRASEKLFLKGERCFSQKCGIIRKNYPPGAHGARRRMRVSEYSMQLSEKQKMKNSYGIRETQLVKYFKIAEKSHNLTADALLRLLEMRLDNAIFRSGFAFSRSVARQFVSHGHFLVNGRKINIPSYNVAVGDIIKIRPQSVQNFKDLEVNLKNYNLPKWLELNIKKNEIKILAVPNFEDIGYNGNPSLVIEYYSR